MVFFEYRFLLRNSGLFADIRFWVDITQSIGYLVDVRFLRFQLSLAEGVWSPLLLAVNSKVIDRFHENCERCSAYRPP